VGLIRRQVQVTVIDKQMLLALLREGENYISGQELCSHFGVSRNAIWKVINQLRSEGYEIEAVSNKGYRLVSMPDILSKENILCKLRSRHIGRDLYYFPETDSTNTRIRYLVDEGADDGALAVADVQNAGKGRRGRAWITPPGMNIAMSLLLKPQIAPNSAPMITLVMALAVARGIREVTGLNTQIKWPNDIVVNGRKVCGILTEMDMEIDYIRAVIVGVGINVNESSSEDFAPEFRDTATSLKMECGETIERSLVIAACMEAFEDCYDVFLKQGNLSGLRAEYEDMLVSRGKEVRVLDPAGEFSGVSEGINENGELLVRISDGSIKAIYAGEVSVRGLYGYT